MNKLILLIFISIGKLLKVSEKIKSNKKIFFFKITETVNASVHSSTNIGTFQFDCLEVNFTARLVIPIDRGIMKLIF